MDATSFVLGIPGLLAACAELYRLAVDAKRIGHDGVILMTKISIEQAKFYAWLEDVGFLDSKQPLLRLRPVLQKVLHDTLEAMKLTLTSLDEIIDKYLLVDGGTVTNLKFSLPEKFWNLHKTPPNSLEERSKAIRRKNRLSLNLVTWAVDDLQRSRDFVNDLRTFNEDLKAISGDLRDTSFALLPSKVLSQVLDSSNLQQLIEATAESDPDLSLCAALKKEVLILAQDSNSPVNRQLPRRRNQWSITVKTGFQNGRHRRLAEYKENSDTPHVYSVILEDKSYNSSATDYQAFVEKRVDEVCRILVAPKPEKARTLECVGYFPDRPRKCFSFIYKFPLWAAPSEPPASLENIISSERKRPALGDRFALAHTLATSVLLLQTCGVLHKGLATENVLFFKPSSDTDHDLSKPFIVGFDYARLHGQTFISDTVEPSFADTRLYSHPDYSFSDKQRYLKIFDLYSLGLLLVQIALWTTMTDLVARLQAFSTHKPTRAQLREALLRSLAYLRPEVGDIFTKVVGRCITGDVFNHSFPTQVLPATSDEIDSGEAIQSAVLRNIVNELGLCCA